MPLERLTQIPIKIIQMILTWSEISFYFDTF
jgi:hypothetical protein